MTTRFTVTVSFDDFIAANLLYQRRHWLWSGLLKMLCFTGLAFALTMLVITALDEPLSWLDILAQLISGLFFGLFMAVLIPILSLIRMRVTARRLFEQLSLGLPITYEIDGAGSSAANAQGRTNLTWDKFSDCVQDRRLLLLRRTSAIFFILPKSQLASGDLDTLLALLRGAGVKES